MSLTPEELYKQLYGGCPPHIKDSSVEDGLEDDELPLHPSTLKSPSSDNIEERLVPRLPRETSRHLRLGVITPAIEAAHAICDHALLLYNGHEISLVYKTRQDAEKAYTAFTEQNPMENISIPKKGFPDVAEYKSFRGETLGYMLTLSEHSITLMLPDQDNTEPSQHTIRRPQNKSFAAGIERMAKKIKAEDFHVAYFHTVTSADNAVSAFVKGSLPKTVRGI